MARLSIGSAGEVRTPDCSLLPDSTVAMVSRFLLKSSSQVAPPDLQHAQVDLRHGYPDLGVKSLDPWRNQVDLSQRRTFSWGNWLDLGAREA